MSARRYGVAAPVVVKLPAMDAAAPAQPLRAGDLLPDCVLDELADKLSNRVVERLVNPLAGRVVDLAGRRENPPDIPDGAKYATSEQLAARYQLSVQWVESRAAKLGATPISDSTNSKLRYHLATADSYMDSRRRRAPTRVRGTGGHKPTATKPTHTRTGRPLLDVE